MRYRIFSEQDTDALQALDLSVQRHLDPAFDTLPERERAGRLHTSLPALKFYERSEHSFVAEEGGQLAGFIFAQSVWQGDKPIVLVRTLSVSPAAPADTAQGLLHATIKSAYDTAVYEVHFPSRPAWRTPHAPRKPSPSAPTPCGIWAVVWKPRRVCGWATPAPRHTPPGVLGFRSSGSGGSA